MQTNFRNQQKALEAISTVACPGLAATSTAAAAAAAPRRLKDVSLLVFLSFATTTSRQAAWQRAVPGRKSALSIRQMTVAMSAPQLPLSASGSAVDPLPTLICCHPNCPSSRIILCCSFIHCYLGCLSYEDGAGLRPGTNVHMIQPAAHKKDTHTQTHSNAAHTSRTHTHPAWRTQLDSKIIKERKILNLLQEMQIFVIVFAAWQTGQ